MIGKFLGRRRILSDREQELMERVATALERFGSDVASEDATSTSRHSANTT